MIETQKSINEAWDINILPILKEYIKIPNVSPAFDPDWKKNGHMDKALQLALQWLEKHKPENSKIQVEEAEGRTPLIYIEVDGQLDDTVLLYGHFDKQPEMTGWSEGLGPWKPVVKNDKLYGRGGADDGYALFASVAAINSCQKQNISLPRMILLIEFSEESGSLDLPYYCDKLLSQMGEVSLVVCLDSGALNYEQMWMTTSLRGLLSAELRVEVLEEGVHSGEVSGALADSFRILRILLDRLEDASTGYLKLSELHTDIPQLRSQQAKDAATEIGEAIFTESPVVSGLKSVAQSWDEYILRRTWHPSLTYIGVEGLPGFKQAGNVHRPYTSLKLSFRLPPTADYKAVQEKLTELLCSDPPYGAKVSLKITDAANGWNAPVEPEWFRNLLNECSQTWFEKPALYTGQGGSIPFMGMLGEKFPNALFVITGVLGPKSNAHGPNEFLHIPYAKKLTGCIAQILANYCKFKP